MLPLQQAYEVKQSLLEYLKATFSFKDRAVHQAFYKFINHSEEGIFKGPYVSLKLPFVKATDSQEIPLSIKPDFPPYDHQYKAFQRLSSDAQQPQSTLITTGTSSGKTECFMYPVLDFCYKNLHRRGIKVIIMYPMNALATDQAKRLAESIWADERLKGKLSVGLFIGEGKDRKKFPESMGENHVIENRNSIIDSPPDILLTNFKMLDYSLMRSEYHNLWHFNFEDASLLQFLVLDELHTYDGAQGTDVANLIRRLKLKLGIEKGQLCAVGTSATIGSGTDSVQLLTEYAEKVFGEKFGEGSIITENRETVEDFFVMGEEQLETFIPRPKGIDDSRLKESDTYESYINRQKRLWQISETIDAVQLGNELKNFKIVKDLISLTHQHIKPLTTLIEELALKNAEFKRLTAWDNQNEFSPREEIINSILALISEAKVGSGRKFPFLYVQIQLWIRELSGILRSVNPEPNFTWKDKAGEKYEPKALPSYFCRECGSSGWLGVKDDNKNHFFSDPKQVYEYFFENHKNVYFINTLEHGHMEEYEPSSVENRYIHPITLELKDSQETDAFKIQAVRKIVGNKTRHICPECNAENAMGIIGTRIATMSSITVSQVLSSDLDPRPDHERKILAFTNSVQDAAHQAGFVEARNYRFTFRSSLQKVINQQNGIIDITELQNKFIDYWKTHADESGKNNVEAYYYRFFPADYVGKMDIQSDYRKGKKFTQEFIREFDQRIRWEIISEFGYNAIIGRTLEKTGASAIKFDEAKLQQIYPAMEDWLRANNLEGIQPTELLTFVNGILHRIRRRGGIDHEYLSKFRSENLQMWDLNWMRDNRHFLNKLFHPRARFPKLLSTQAHTRGVLDTTFTNTNNWFRSYFTKSFLLVPNAHAIVNDFYKKLIEVMVNLELMNQAGEDAVTNFTITPKSVLVENKVKHYQCDNCGSMLSVAYSDTLSNMTKCLDYSCSGTYRPSPETKSNYYQLVYNRTRSPRIYASEHTGILERKDRENKEIDFKERPNFNSLNTIVATSTLEMGIDIGTLNTAINNSVPPLTTNFLQRVGRAGRSSGSALINNFVGNKAHDLFYFEEPLDMMEGEIATPGCYLEAKDILYRHFFAYCLDNWTSNDAKNNSIPKLMMTLRLMNTDLEDKDFFSNRLISFIKSKERHLLNQFCNFYESDLTDVKVLENLRKHLSDESFYLRIKNVFHKLKQAYQTIHEKRKDIDDLIKTNNLSASDDERKMLESESKALWGLKRLLDKRSVLEHLTNVGLLPNYAFPETGVTLNAWVKSAKAKASDSIPADKQYEIVRSSSAAIREFAPDNFFYSQGHKFTISGINTFDWKDAGVLLRKRFCSNCDHIEDAGVSNVSHCPKCQDISWSSLKNQHVFVKLSNVKSVNTREDATLDDSSDDRDSTYYRISKHISFDYHTFQGAWGMKEIPFGIEYVKNVVITEVNLGLSSEVDANKITINQQEEIPYHGFVTCKYCGKSTSTPRKAQFDDRFKLHYGYCKNKDSLYLGKSDAVFEEVYLFREVKTEALKALLPVQEFENEATVNMFKAGLELGLKKYYKGNPQHLSMVNYSEYNKLNTRFDRYLVIYDNIPGGTGYLEKLFNPVEFTEVINHAYQSIRDCGCQHNGKDGCYRCIYTYSNQFIQSELSREKAEILFKKIAEKSSAWESYQNGLRALAGTGQIEESELEDRFIRSLRNYLQNRHDFGDKFEDFKSDGIMNYRFKITNGEYGFYYMIRPQHSLGPSEGVAYMTRTDFYITLTAAEKNGEMLDEDTVSFAKGIAIYLDGYTYHASKEHNNFFKDVEKRVAIVKSGDKISWTLTWADIERFDTIEKDNDPKSFADKRDFLALDKVKYRDTIAKYKVIPYWRPFQSSLIESKNTFERLLWYLTHPLKENRSVEKIGLMLSLRQTTFASPSVDAEDIATILGNNSPLIDATLQAKNKAKGSFYVFPEIGGLTDFANVKVGVQLANLHTKATVRLLPLPEQNLDKVHWQEFWLSYNLVQNDIELLVNTNQIIDNETVIDSYECLKYFDNNLHFIIKYLIDNDIEFNQEGGFFVEDEGVFAEALFGFKNQKIFFKPISLADKAIFEKAGYTEMEVSNFKLETIII